MNRIITLIFLFISAHSYAQNVGINATGAPPNASAMLDISSTTSGLLIPRMTSAQRTAIATPATGLLVYDTSLNMFYYYNGTMWVPMATSGGWLLSGNTLTGTQIFGSLNNQPIRFVSNNIERLRLTGSGFFGIFNLTPTVYVHYTSPGLINDFQWQLDNTQTGDAVSRSRNTLTSNGSRVVMGVTNYNANSFQAAAIIGIALSTSGSGGIGVQGVTNSPAATGVYCGNQNPTGSTSGWGLFSNNWSGGVTAWQNVSDSRIKRNIKTISNSLDIIKSLRGVEYYFDTEKYNDINLPENKQYGFIAQEVETVLPEIVRQANITGYQNIKVNDGISQPAKNYTLKVLSYSYIIPVLVEALKEQQKQIDELKSEINKLKRD